MTILIKDYDTLFLSLIMISLNSFHPNEGLQSQLTQLFNICVDFFYHALHFLYLIHDEQYLYNYFYLPKKD